MGRQFNIGEAKTRLSELVAAAVRGEEVILAKAGQPQVKLSPVAEASTTVTEARAAKRRLAFGIFTPLVGKRDIDVHRIKLEDGELQQSYQAKFGPAA